MTSTTTKNSAGVPQLEPKGPTGNTVFGAEQYQPLGQTPAELPMTQRIPTSDTLKESAAKTLQTILRQLEIVDNADAAKIYIEYILDAGNIFKNPRELLRAVEERLPSPTPAQRELSSVCRENNTGAMLFCRPLGAFGDYVLAAHADPEQPARIKISKLRILRSETIPAPAWDPARPETRRRSSKVITAEETPEVVPASRATSTVFAVADAVEAQKNTPRPPRQATIAGV